MTDKNKIIVKFNENISINNIINEINKIENPQIIFWYIGYNGLKKKSVDFYKNIFIDPILKQKHDLNFWLIDLTAWNAFKNSKRAINKISSHCDLIENSSIEQIKCIKSADIFKIMQTISDQKTIKYFKNALKKSFIKKSSETFSLKNISVREIFSNNCIIMEEYYDCDVAKSYSVFQYFEGCLLVKEIFLKVYKNTNSKNLQIIFILPNDELKYYHDSEDSFQKDISFLFQKYYKTFDTLSIIFYSFNYGTKIHHRPYNERGKVIKKHDLKIEDITRFNRKYLNELIHEKCL